MKFRLPLLAALLFIATAGAVSADTGKSPVPQNVKLEKPEDYNRYKPDVLRCISYLESTPLSADEDVRKEVNAFLMMWLTGSPDVTMNMHAYVMDFVKDEPDALMLFIAGYAQYAIEHKELVEVDANVAGLKAVVDFYSAGKGLKKTKGLDNLASLHKSGRLPAYVAEKLKEKN